jgi:hypothetical protein
VTPERVPYPQWEGATSSCICNPKKFKNTPSISKIPNTKEFQSNRSLVYKGGAHVEP